MVRSKNSAVFGFALKCIETFPPPLLFSSALDKGLVSLNTAYPLSSNDAIIASSVVSHNPFGLLSASAAFRR